MSNYDAAVLTFFSMTTLYGFYCVCSAVGRWIARKLFSKDEE